ncbi:MAG: alpha-ketoglutarate-dependent dioxygenase AlkB [bacterium]
MLNLQQTDLFTTLREGLPEAPDIQYISSAILEYDNYFNYLRDNLSWDSTFKSRQTATFGASYNYRSGVQKSGPMPHFLKTFCCVIEQNFAFHPNNCLANYYPDGNHYISFHSDQDLEMKNQTGVAIVSLGAVREMVLRHIGNPKIRYVYPLEPGSVFFMTDRLQTIWQHGIPKQSGRGPRISLSFRSLLRPGDSRPPGT